jgi:DNA-binding Lrp family transcriptional regulator
MYPFSELAMSQSTSQVWQKAALDTLLWLLDPDRYEADKAYLRLFKRLVAFLRQRGSFDPEELAEKTLAKVAETVYLRLTGLRREDVDRADLVHEVPREVAQEVYTKERERLTPLAFAFAKHSMQEQYRRARRSRLDALEAPFLQEDPAIAEEQLVLMRDLRTLSAEDQRLLKEYYDLADTGKRQSRSDLAKQLGLTTSALRVRAEKLRRRVIATMTAREAPAQAQFTAYYPRSIERRNWSTILAYMHVADALPLVQSDSRRRLNDAGERIASKTANRKLAIARGAQIIVVPQSQMLEFNPPQVAFAWLEDFHCAEFRCRVRSGVNADNQQPAAVNVAFYVTPILVAEISFAIAVSKKSEQGRPPASVTAHPYQRVFVSYSHSDNGIADQLEKAYKALGIEYLRDVRMLRSGEKWAPTLLERIDESEIFQLLWSKAAKQSVYVRKEWEHALGLHRGFFIRPVYWNKPMPPPPRELADIHFAYLELRSNQL